TSQEVSQEQDVAGGMNMLFIDRHLDPETGPIDPDVVPVGAPFRALDHRSEQAPDLVDRRLQAAARFVETSAMLDGKVDERHRVDRSVAQVARDGSPRGSASAHSALVSFLVLQLTVRPLG